MENFNENNINNENESNDLFSYDNSNNIAENSGSTFDLNSFSTKAEAEQEKQKRKKPKNKKMTVLKILLSVFLVGVITATTVVGAFMFYAFTMVDGTMDEDLENSLNFTTTIYVDDGNGKYKEYRRLHGEYNRIWVDYDKIAIENKDPNYDGIPQMLANAFIAIEDKRFYKHNGVDIIRSGHATINYLFGKGDFGGSTITQQLIKNLTGRSESTPQRKIKEAFEAIDLEKKYTKSQILEMYLNIINL